MLDEICGSINNYFTAKEDIHAGTYSIEGGALVLPFLVPGQYYRIVGSALNDGVYQYREPAGDGNAGSGDDIANTGDDNAGSGDDNANTGDDNAGTGEENAEDEAQALSDETFTGEIWAMKVPRAFLVLAGEIEAWDAKYGATMASPFQSENIIGVYSYTKGADGGGASGAAWERAFKSRLNRWRKIR